MDIEKIFKGEGGYVFVSHSHLDIKTVREVRNFLEEKGFEPILFYLKSLDDGKTDKTFLRSLIYDEIDAREFFLYLESQNAKNSQWVQEEINYVNARAPEKIYVLNLEQGLDYLKEQVEKLARKMRIFISFTRADEDIFLRLKRKLIERDFRIYGDEQSIYPGGSWFDDSAKTIKDIAKEGTVLVLLSQTSLHSRFVSMEVQLALREGGNVIPIIINDGDTPVAELPPQWKFLADVQSFTLSKNATEEQVAALVSKIAKAAQVV